MPTFKVKSNVSFGTRDGETVTTKDYKAGDSIELTEAQAREISFALEDAPADESIPESTRMRPDHKESGVAAAHKVDLPAAEVAASQAKALQNVLDSPSAEFSDDAALADDLAVGATDNLPAARTVKRTSTGGSRTEAPAVSPTTSTPAPKP